MKNKYLVRLIGFALLLSILTACGGNLEPTIENNGEPSTEVSSISGDRWLRMAVSGSPDLDPAAYTSWSRVYCYLNVYDSLVMYDSFGNLTPLLAESWEVSNDGLSYTFKLKQGVKFHDGSELTSSDIAFTWNRLSTLASGFAYLYKNIIDTVDAVDDYTVVFTLVSPYGTFLETLTRMYIVNEDLIMSNLDFQNETFNYGDVYGDFGRTYLLDHDAGSGPYQTVEMSQQNYLIASAFQDYHLGWNENAPNKIQIINNTEPTTIRTMLASRELELSDNWQSPESLDAFDKIDGIEIAPFSMSAQQQLNLNISKPPLDDLYFRRALASLVDYESLAENVFPDSVVATGPSNKNTPGAATNHNNYPYSYNIEKSKEYLALSKYADSLDQYPVEFFTSSAAQIQPKLALPLQAAAQQVGITVEITSAPLATQQERNANSDTTPHIETYSFAPYYWDAGTIFETHYSSRNEGNGNNTMWLSKSDWSNVVTPNDIKLTGIEDWDHLIGSVMSITNQTERFAKYAMLENIIMDNVFNIPLASITERVAYQAEYVMWPTAEHYKTTGELASTSVGYQFWFHDFEVYNDKVPQQ
ncbi:MAG: ABC transporter substrate-binding protein [Clostridiaceae bacterium]|nr:ABC transporter substrate-binding protein [Clostridiaceae bacterium]